MLIALWDTARFEDLDIPIVAWGAINCCEALPTAGLAITQSRCECLAGGQLALKVYGLLYHISSRRAGCLPLVAGTLPLLQGLQCGCGLATAQHWPAKWECSSYERSLPVAPGNERRWNCRPATVSGARECTSITCPCSATGPSLQWSPAGDTPTKSEQHSRALKTFEPCAQSASGNGGYQLHTCHLLRSVLPSSSGQDCHGW